MVSLWEQEEGPGFILESYSRTLSSGPTTAQPKPLLAGGAHSHKAAEAPGFRQWPVSPGGSPSQGTKPQLLGTELGLLLRDRSIPKAQASMALTFPSQDGGDKVKTWRDRTSKQAEGRAEVF